MNLNMQNFPRIPVQQYQKRLQSLRSRMQSNSIALFIAPKARTRNHDVEYPYRADSDLLYLTGENSENLALIISKDDGLRIYIPDRDPDLERWVGPGISPENLCDRLGLSVSENIFSMQNLFTDLPELLKAKTTLYCDLYKPSFWRDDLLEQLGKILANSRKGQLPPLNISHPSILISEMRLVKDEFELEIMRRAAAISAVAHTATMGYTRQFQDGIDEFSIRNFLENKFRQQGSYELAYPSIVAGGNNATILHYTRTDARVLPHDLILIDAGCEVAGYASDITRTFPAGGYFQPAQRDIYSLVLTAQKNAIAKACAGNSFLSIHDEAVRTLVQGLWDLGLMKSIYWKGESMQEAEKVSPAGIEEIIEKEYYKLFYMHSTSHFLGLDVHDTGNYFLNGKSRPLIHNMVLTIEPGLYFPREYDWLSDDFRGIGVRIEDDIVIRADSPEILTGLAKKEIHEIEEIASLS